MGKDEGHFSKEVHYRRRVHRLRKESQRRRLSGCRTCPEVHWERDESLAQLHARIQRRVRNRCIGSPGDFSEPRPSTEVAEGHPESVGETWSSEEEVFKGTREEVVSWIKSYVSDSGCVADTGLFHPRRIPMKRPPKNKMSTHKPGSYTVSDAAQESFFYNQHLFQTKPPTPNDQRSTAKTSLTLARTCVRFYRLTKSFVCWVWESGKRAVSKVL